VLVLSGGAEHLRCRAGMAGHAAVGFLRGLVVMVTRGPAASTVGPPSQGSESNPSPLPPQTWEQKRALREARMSQVVESASSAGTGMLAATAHAPWEP
jgi:hypothetical protein